MTHAEIDKINQDSHESFVIPDKWEDYKFDENIAKAQARKIVEHIDKSMIKGKVHIGGVDKLLYAIDPDKWEQLRKDVNE